MILCALARYYDRLCEQGVADVSPYGYSLEKISFVLVLSPEGRVVDVRDLRERDDKKARPRLLSVPQPPKRTVGISSALFWDKTSYVLGVSATSKRSDKEHAAFKALHATALTETDDEGLLALRHFVENWEPIQFDSEPFASRGGEEIRDANVVFQLDGVREFIHERPAARIIRSRLLAQHNDDDPEGESVAAMSTGPSSNDQPMSMCLVTGEPSRPARLHPSIKGVNGAQTAGAALVSFNLDAFSSYGKAQGENAPVSAEAAFAYTTALNYLLRRGEHHRQRVQVGDATVVFWAEAESANEAHAAEVMIEGWFKPPDDEQESSRLGALLTQVASGRAQDKFDGDLQPGTKLYVLGLAPNAARLSIRYWEQGTLQRFAQRLQAHADDLRIEPIPWKTPPSVWRLALTTAPSIDGRAKSDDVPPQLAGELMRAVLTGGAYPRSLLANILMRMRADGDVSDLRIALCKGVLTRAARIARTMSPSDQVVQQEIPVSLDTQSKHPGYRLGRLFAVIESAQRLALNSVNASIRDRYWGSASATPASVFPILLRNVQHHLASLRRSKPGLAINLERDMNEIINGLPGHLPRSLTLDAQGRFAIGYYHQRHANVGRSGGKIGSPQDQSVHDDDDPSTGEAA